MKFTPLILPVFLLVLGCSKPGGQETAETATAPTEEQLREQADSLAQAIIIADTHVDLPYRLVDQKIRPTGDNLNVILSTRDGDFDYERAKQGGLDAQDRKSTRLNSSHVK